MRNTWFIVPARGGSKGIPKKNVRVLGNHPLITYVLKTISKVADRNKIIVSTDDEEIESISRRYATIHHRSSKYASDKATLDEVVADIAEWLLSTKEAKPEDKIITVQTTSPFLNEQTLRNSSEMLSKDDDVDTVLTVKDDRHLRWGKSEEGNIFPKYEKRLNRQWLPAEFVETGGVIGCTISHILKKDTRIGNNIELIEVGEREGLDIDSYADWALAEYWVNKLKIIIRVDGSNTLGFGHLYRGLAIAECLTLHDVIFLTRSDGEYEMGAHFLERHHYPMKTIDNFEEGVSFIKKEHPQMVINDILDTDEGYISQLKEEGIFTINFEDLGSGNKLADIVVNDLYPDLFPKENHWYGVEYAILNPQFEHIPNKREINEKVETILIAFGGTDPNNFTVKTLEAINSLKHDWNVKVVVGPGYSFTKKLKGYVEEIGSSNIEVHQDVNNMAELMSQSDLAITSAGRTVTELMVAGVPTIALCQNIREMRHNHATSAYGVVNLGIGESVDCKALAEHINLFHDNYSLRKDMFLRMKKAVAERSNEAIVEKIIKAYKIKQKQNT